MQRITIILLAFLLFEFSYSLNVVKNTFIPSQIVCLIGVNDFAYLGEWEKTEEANIPEKLFFNIGTNICLFTKKDKNAIKCHGEIETFPQIVMDENGEYILKALDSFGIDTECEYTLSKNIFIPTGEVCINDEDNTILGGWRKTTEIPENLHFNLKMNDGTKKLCTFSRMEKDIIRCEVFFTNFAMQFMDENGEYIIESPPKISFIIDCQPPPVPTTDPSPDPSTDPSPDPSTNPSSSSFLYFSLQILMVIILLLF